MKCRYCKKELRFGGASSFNPLRENLLCRNCYDLYTNFNGKELLGYLSNQPNYNEFSIWIKNELVKGSFSEVKK